MGITSKIILLVTALALSACTNPNRFGANGAGGANGANGADGGITSGALGDPSNPASPAYFNATIGNTVRFMVDQSNLTPEAQATLRAQAQWMMQNTSYSALIEGHADEQGTRVYNINLGERRANAVREFLISQGVSGARLKTISYGKERPLAICSEESCYAQNRRSVTVLTAGAGS